MDNEEIQGVKFSEFPSATPDNADEVVGLHSGDNARFSVANFILAIRQGLANLFVPLTRTINNKALSSDITLDASDVGAVDTAEVGVADGVAGLDSNGKVPSSQLPPISSDAADITYDPTTSGASATNVQDALDEAFDDLDGKQDSITASGILKGDGAGGVSAATAGTDYQAPLTAGTDYATPAQLADKANQSQLAYVETGTTATRNYTAGQYISLNGLLYTADTAIASGATFYTSGGNKNLTECVGGGFNKLAIKNFQKTVTPPAAYYQGTISELSGKTVVAVHSYVGNNDQIWNMPVWSQVGTDFLLITFDALGAVQNNQNKSLHLTFYYIDA